jgi:ubiquinone/menaquinone biosynthesis C-methylase UbiE
VSDSIPHSGAYIVASSATEQQRLLAQAERLAPLTRRLFRDAGIAPGMRVLDLGCGLGDVSLLVAALVGPHGAVVGVDRDTSSLAVARARAAEQGLAMVTFVEGDVHDLGVLTAGPAFDALVGRAILGHVADRAAVLRAAAALVRPGGVIAFQEADITLAELTVARSQSELLRRVLGWFAVGHPRFGKPLPCAMLELPEAFRAAGLPTPQLRSTTELGVGAEAYLLPQLVGILRGLLPTYERLGVVTAAAAEIETLEARLRAEVAAVDPEAVLAAWSFVDAWATKGA